MEMTFGSSSFITGATGEPTQHLEYLPFGELFIEERSTWNTPYKFSAKELDDETGYSYFGARYNDPNISIWLSVDPLSDKYPGWSAYTYCLNNPLRFIDPNGAIPWPISKTYNEGNRKIVSGMYRNSTGKFHGGVDIVHKTPHGNLSGGAIIATHDGIVTQSGVSTTAGNWVQITNGDIRTTYMHMESPSELKKGQEVTETDYIGNVGSTGRSEGPHLHYQIEKFNPESGTWDKINPVIGDQSKVDASMDVDLKDPQQMINERDAYTNTGKQFRKENANLGGKDE